MTISTRIAPCLWFDRQAEEAARYYVGIFKNSKITSISHFGKEGHEIHGQPEGLVLTVQFELDGQPFTALNGGPNFKFNEAVSLQIYCDSQEEIDDYWGRLAAGGDPAAQQCGWLKDKFGLSWQVVPRMMEGWLAGGVNEKTERVMKALMQMKKLDIARLNAAYAG
jgi:predicted 3-demethylubiquinone-9 3-methyltransferase (glyoxalase superfamily)